MSLAISVYIKLGVDILRKDCVLTLSDDIVWQAWIRPYQISNRHTEYLSREDYKLRCLGPSQLSRPALKDSLDFAPVLVFCRSYEMQSVETVSFHNLYLALGLFRDVFHSVRKITNWHNL